MTDYNGEQNNILGAVQPVEVSPVEAEPVVASQPQVAEPVAPAGQTYEQPQPVATQYQAPVAPVEIPVAPVYQTPAEPQPVATQYQAPVAHVEIPVAPVYQAPAEPQPPKKSKAPIIISIMAVLLVIVLAVVLVLVSGDKEDDKKEKDNKKETEQVADDNSSEDDSTDEAHKDDKDKGDKDDKDDKDDKGDEDDKDDTHNDEQSDSQKDEQDDTSDTAPEDRGYMEYLNALGNLFTGDVHSFEKLLPSGVWELMCLGKAEELGYIPTKEEVVEIFIEESFADVNESEFIDSYELSIYQEKSVDSDTIDMLQKNLRSYLIMKNIDEAYEVSFRFVMEKDGMSEMISDTAYAVNIGGEWTFMSLNGDLYVFDGTLFGEMDESFEVGAI